MFWSDLTTITINCNDKREEENKEHNRIEKEDNSCEESKKRFDRQPTKQVLEEEETPNVRLDFSLI